jgi:tetratricopeptide (TPR) repeat protein
MRWGFKKNKDFLMRGAVSKLLLALLSLESVSMSAFALSGTLADLENANPDTTTPKAIQAPKLSSKEEARIDNQLYQQMMKRAHESRDPKAINAYLDLARKIKSKQLGTTDEKAELQSRADFYSQQIKDTPANQLSDDLYYELAKSQDGLGKPDAAAISMKEMLARFPKSPYAAEAHFRIAEDAFNRQDFRTATQEYQAVLSRGDSKYKQQAQYFYAWSLYKQGHFEEAVEPFQELIIALHATAEQKGPAGLSKRDTLLLQDSYKVLSSIFVQIGGAPALAKYYQGKPMTEEEVLMYRQVGDRYRDQKQLLDTAKTYESFVKQHPATDQAAIFSRDAIAVYNEAGFAQDIIRAKSDYVERYDVNQSYFKGATPEQQQTLRPILKSQLDDLAKHYDAVGQTQKSTADYLHAADLYQKQLALATDPADMIRIQQRLAEALYNGGQYERAIPYFEALAYKTPAAKPSEMGYFALLSYQAHAKELASQPATAQSAWLDLQRDSSIQYAKSFPSEKNASIVLMAMAGQYLDRKRFDVVGDLARRVLALPGISSADIKTASILKANADFDQSHWSDAEAGYRQVLTLSGLSDADKSHYQNQLAGSLYKQAEVAKAANNHDAALKLYQQAADVTLDPAVKVDGSYQAAMIYGETPQALPLLQSFYSKYPNSPQAEGIPERIVKLQEGKQDWSGAAETYMKIYQRDIGAKDVAKQNNALIALWLAANSEHKVAANNPKELALYLQYIKEPHAVLTQSVEASERLYQAALLQHDTAAQQRELARQMQFYQQISSAPAPLQPRLKYFAARALTLQIAPVIEQYRAQALAQPLKDSIARKQVLLKNVLDREQPILDLKVAEFVTQSQFVLGDSFTRFYQGVMKLPAPTGLSELEAEQYQIAIEEQAQPLKDKAIEWHKANASLADDAWDNWVGQSLDALATLSPGRYLRPIKKPAIPATLPELTRIAATVDAQPEKALADLTPLLASAQQQDQAATAADAAKATAKPSKKAAAQPVVATGNAAATNLQLVQSYRGIALIRLGKFKDAAAALGDADAINSRATITTKLPEASYLLGVTDDLYLGEQAGALAAYQRYLAINPDDKSVQKWVNLLQKELKLPLTQFNKPVVAAPETTDGAVPVADGAKAATSVAPATKDAKPAVGTTSVVTTPVAPATVPTAPLVQPAAPATVPASPAPESAKPIAPVTADPAANPVVNSMLQQQMSKLH